MRGWRGVAAGALTLIVIETLGAGKGPEQGGKLLGWAVSGLRRALSPDVPAIPTVGKKTEQGGKPAAPGNPNEIRGALPRNPTIAV